MELEAKFEEVTSTTATAKTLRKATGLKLVIRISTEYYKLY